MKEKRLDYELLRLLAIFLVVFNHSQERGFELYMLENVSRVNYYGSLLLGIICKIAVPLFFLVSGGLLLHREEPIRTVLRKRVSRIGISLILFSGILYLFWVRWGYRESPGMVDCLRQFWESGISAPYWYLYAYLGLMLMLPLLRPLAQHMTDRAYVYLIGLHLIVFGVLRTIGQLLGWGPINPDLMLPLAEPEVFYFLLGHYLAHRFPWEKLTGKRLGLLWLLATVSVIGMLAMADLQATRTGASEIGYHNGWMLIPVLAVYMTVRRLVERHPPSERAGKVIVSLGGCVFGTYLLEGILRHYLGFVFEALEPKIHVLPACIVWVALVVLAGLCLTWILRKIPGIRRVL